MSEWIDVNDRLPDKPGRYLVYVCPNFHKTYFTIAYHKIVYFFTGHKADRILSILDGINPRDLEEITRPGWYDWDSDIGYFEYSCVGFWMPLPEPPKAEWRDIPDDPTLSDKIPVPALRIRKTDNGSR